MLRSLYAGVSGLQNHQTRMDVIGNNISNVNTTGFKKGRVTFQDLISMNLAGSSAPRAEVGGINPKQVGLGMTVASIDTIQQQGSLKTTGVTSDLAIQGEGFFILRNGQNQFYSRAGAFGVDGDGYLVNPANGMRIQGWMVEEENGETVLNTSASVGDITIPIGGKDPASPTENVYLSCNLDKRTPVIPPNPTAEETRGGTWTTSYDIYDAFGGIHTLQMEFTRVEDQENRWQMNVTIDPNADYETNTTVDVGELNNLNDQLFVQFDNLGRLESVTDGQGDVVDEDDVQVQIGYEVPNANPTEAGDAARQTFTMHLGEVGSVVDTITHFAEKSSTKVFKQNGYGMGYLESFQVDQEGLITGAYSNGSSRVLGQIGLASFVNPGGLKKVGETNFIETNNSGEPDISTTGIGSKGSTKIISGALEMSNVDLAEQFTDMIVTQRGFQANSKSITTSDQLLQELLTLKR